MRFEWWPMPGRLGLTWFASRRVSIRRVAPTAASADLSTPARACPQGCPRKPPPAPSTFIAAIVEVAEERLPPEAGSELRADNLELDQHPPRRPWRGGLLRSKQRVPLALCPLDLIEQQFEPIEFAAVWVLSERPSPGVNTSSRWRRSRRSGSSRRPGKTAAP